MGHSKFHKVYPNATAVMTAIKKPITAKTESQNSSIWRSVIRSFRKKWLELITTVVLIWTLRAYLEANELNRRALIEAHTPVVVPFNLNVAHAATGHIAITYTLIDFSESVAIGVHSTGRISGVDSAPQNLRNYASVMLAPNIAFPMFYDTYGANDDDLYRDLATGNKTIDIIVSYQDIANHPYKVVVTFQNDGTKYKPINFQFSGVDSF